MLKLSKLFRLTVFFNFRTFKFYLKFANTCTTGLQPFTFRISRFLFLIVGIKSHNIMALVGIDVTVGNQPFLRYDRRDRISPFQ